MTIKIYGHPWSINTRKTLMTLAEKKQPAELVLVMLPKGEQKQPEHLARHPFAKVPVLEIGDFVLYETRAINRYLDHKLGGVPLMPSSAEAVARVDQWTNVADAYFVPHAGPMLVEILFRKYLGGQRNEEAITGGRDRMQRALDVVDEHLSNSEYLAGPSFSLADIHWIPYLEYMWQTSERESISRRRHLSAWWSRVSARPAWLEVARSGPQPYES